MESVNRIGRISSINYEKGTADVYFEYYEKELKANLPFLSLEYNMPNVNDLVLVSFQKYNSREQGYIIGKYYSEENQPEAGLREGDFFKRLSEHSFVKVMKEGDVLIQLSETAGIRYDAESDILYLSAGKVKVVNNDA